MAKTSIFGSATATVFEMLKMFLLINLYLAFFNMLPLHPLDGGKVFERFLPFEWNRWLQEHQYHLNMALLFLIIMGGLRFMAMPINYIFESSLRFVLGAA